MAGKLSVRFRIGRHQVGHVWGCNLHSAGTRSEVWRSHKFRRILSGFEIWRLAISVLSNVSWPDQKQKQKRSRTHRKAGAQARGERLRGRHHSFPPTSRNLVHRCLPQDQEYLGTYSNYTSRLKDVSHFRNETSRLTTTNILCLYRYVFMNSNWS